MLWNFYPSLLLSANISITTPNGQCWKYFCWRKCPTLQWRNMTAEAYEITDHSTVYWTTYSGYKKQSSNLRIIHQWPADCSHNGLLTWVMRSFPCHNVIIIFVISGPDLLQPHVAGAARDHSGGRLYLAFRWASQLGSRHTYCLRHPITGGTWCTHC